MDYDVYGAQECRFDYLRSAIAPARSYELWYPNYPQLCVTTWAPRGWGVFVFDPQSAWQADSWLVQQDWDDRSAPSPPDAHPAWAHRIASLQQTEAPNWTSVAHQAPSATVYALAQHLMQHESYDGQRG